MFAIVEQTSITDIIDYFNTSLDLELNLLADIFKKYNICAYKPKENYIFAYNKKVSSYLLARESNGLLIKFDTKFTIACRPAYLPRRYDKPFVTNNMIGVNKPIRELTDGIYLTLYYDLESESNLNQNSNLDQNLNSNQNPNSISIQNPNSTLIQNYNSKWKLATSKSPNASNFTWIGPSTYMEIFLKELEKKYISLVNFATTNSYCFLLQQVTWLAAEDKLTHLCTWVNNREINYDDIGLPQPPITQYNYSTIGSFTQTSHLGYIIYDDDCLYQPSRMYQFIKKMRNVKFSGINHTNRLLYIVLSAWTDINFREFKKVFPTVLPLVRNIESLIIKIRNQCELRIRDRRGNRVYPTGDFISLIVEYFTNLILQNQKQNQVITISEITQIINDEIIGIFKKNINTVNQLLEFKAYLAGES